uniref:Uncharacterized protein n=1 Tax=Meloidogyne enterolobii TaxID=390850 RepID=A0A6V7VK09_MELEN|nr:unnamed protein product [Meloidogyne enterolobii]
MGRFIKFYHTEEYNEKLKVFKEKYAIWNKIYKKFDKDEVEISKEILRLNEEEEKYNKAYDDARNLIETKTLAGSSHKRSRRRGSREVSIGSSEDLRSTRSGEVSVYSHNSNESGSGKILFFKLSVPVSKENLHSFPSKFCFRSSYGTGIVPEPVWNWNRQRSGTGLELEPIDAFS